MKTAIIFDEKGNQYDAKDIDKLFDSLPKEGVKAVFQATYFNHDLLCGIEDLIKVGIIQQVEGDPYPKDEVEQGLENMKGCIIDRYGQESYDAWLSEITKYMEEQHGKKGE